MTLDGIHTRVRVPGTLDVASTTIKNPVTGADAHPGVVLPEGLIVKHADLGCSATFRLTGDVSYDHSGKYAAVGAFDYAGA